MIVYLIMVPLLALLALQFGAGHALKPVVLVPGALASQIEVGNKRDLI